MVGLACPFTMDGSPWCWYGGPLAHQMNVSVWLAHRPHCWWSYMPVVTADPACPLRWWILAPNHGHHLRPTTLMVVPMSCVMVGLSGPRWWLAHVPITMVGSVGPLWRLALMTHLLCLTYRGDYLLIMMGTVSPLQWLVSRESKHDIKESDGSIYSCYH